MKRSKNVKRSNHKRLSIFKIKQNSLKKSNRKSNRKSKKQMLDGNRLYDNITPISGKISRVNQKISLHGVSYNTNQNMVLEEMFYENENIPSEELLDNTNQNMAFEEMLYENEKMLKVQNNPFKYKLTRHSKMIFSEFDKMLLYNSQTENTKNIFKDFYNKFREADEFVSHIDIEKHLYKIEKIENHKKIPKTDDFTYIIPEIRENINDMAEHIIIYKFPSLFERNIEIYFTVNKLDINEINGFVYKMLLWLFVVTKLNNKPSCSRKLEIYIYLTDLIKCLPKNKQKIGKISINTGFTTSCSSESNITIYRREEWFKVFIHESIHNLGLDFSGMNNQNTKNRILKIFPVKSLVKAYESYTDTFARILNVLMCSYLMSPQKTFNTYIENVEKLINVERTYAYFQVVKILSHMGLIYEDLYEFGREDKRKLYSEETSILSYYIIGLILLSDYEKFLSWCQENNNKHSILQFDNVSEKQEKFCDYVENEYKNSKFLKTIKEMEFIFNNMENNKTYILNNVRKSFCEFEIE